MRSSKTAYAAAVRRQTFLSQLCGEIHAALLARTRNAKKERMVAVRIPPGVYEHYESTEEACRLVVVLEVAFNWKGAGPYPAVVRFSPLYGDDRGSRRYLPLLHPDCGFAAPVKPGDGISASLYWGPRFRLIRRLSEEDARNLARRGSSKRFNAARFRNRKRALEILERTFHE